MVSDGPIGSLIWPIRAHWEPYTALKGPYKALQEPYKALEGPYKFKSKALQGIENRRALKS
jgi:hypothetical protein